MALKLSGGAYPLQENGLPEEISGLEETLQNIRIRLNLPQGAFPYGRELGSGLHRLRAGDERAREQALSLAEEALWGMPGVSVERAEFTDSGIRFRVRTPQGEGEVNYGEL